MWTDKPCPNGCNGNGQCDLQTGICNCDGQHQGYDCSGTYFQIIS